MIEKKYKYNESLIGIKRGKLTLLEILKERSPNREKLGLYECECGTKEVKKLHLVEKSTRTSCKACAYRWQNEKHKESCRKMGLNRRVYPNFCQVCGENGHYAKGMCRSCYLKHLRRSKKK